MWITFAHSELALAAAGLTAVPLIIHLLSQRRYRREPWAAMSFLLAAQLRSRRRMQVEQYALLALRTLIVLAIGLAVARPALRAGLAVHAAGRSRMDHVIVLDDTLSMQALREDGRTAFEAARETARELVRGRGAGDAFGLVLLSGGGRALVERPTADAAMLERLLSELSCSFEHAEAGPALAAAADVLEQGDAPPDCRSAYVLTDAAASTWAAAAGGSHAAALGRLADPARRFLIDAGPQRRGNAAIADLRALGGWIAPGLPLTIEAVVRTCDLRLPPDTVVELRLDGHVAQRIPVGAAAERGERRLTAQVRLDRGGPHTIVARIDPGGDALPADDERTAVLLAQERVPLLLVSGGAGRRAADDPLFYLEAALAPEPDVADASARRPVRLFEPRAVAESEFATQVVRGARAVMLADVSRLTPREWARLGEYVREGGGLVVALGPRCDPSGYKDAADLLPATLEAAVVHDQASDARRPRPVDWTHPILADLHGHEGGGLTTAAVRGYVRARPVKADGVRMILALGSGDPLLIERRVGRGRVLLWTSSLDMGWTDLPAKPDFVPLAMNLAAYAAGGGDAALNVEVGRTLVLDAPRETPARAAADADLASPNGVSVRRPDGRVDPAVVFEAVGPAGALQRGIRYEHVDAPGAYDLIESGATRTFAARTAEAESDLAAAAESEFLAAGGGLTWVSDVDEFLARGAAAPRREMSGALLVTLLVLLLGESLLAAVFGRR